jgi:hypothetical protein
MKPPHGKSAGGREGSSMSTSTRNTTKKAAPAFDPQRFLSCCTDRQRRKAVVFFQPNRQPSIIFKNPPDCRGSRGGDHDREKI